MAYYGELRSKYSCHNPKCMDFLTEYQLSKGRKYCSRKCYYEHKRSKKREVMCQHCAKVMNVPLHRFNKVSHLYCSRACYYASTFLKERLKKHGEWLGKTFSFLGKEALAKWKSMQKGLEPVRKFFFKKVEGRELAYQMCYAKITPEGYEKPSFSNYEKPVRKSITKGIANLKVNSGMPLRCPYCHDTKSVEPDSIPRRWGCSNCEKSIDPFDAQRDAKAALEDYERRTVKK